MIRHLLHRFSRQSANLDARLNVSQAERIAREAAGTSPFAASLILRGRWHEAGALIWHFWTPTRGSGLSVCVDDATGEATVETHSGR